MLQFQIICHKLSKNIADLLQEIEENDNGIIAFSGLEQHNNSVLFLFLIFQIRKFRAW